MNNKHIWSIKGVTFGPWKIGDRISGDDVYAMTQRIHRNDSDFDEGDIGERIEQFNSYVLQYVNLSNIDVDEWDCNDDRVAQFAKMTPQKQPPIVLDGSTIIDGTHRCHAALVRGENAILAFVGS
jgi:hypothetical protein